MIANLASYLKSANGASRAPVKGEGGISAENSIRNSPSPSSARPISLSQAKEGCPLRICALQGEACRRLREIGFCEQMEISKLSNGRNMICSMCGTRLAVSRKLGEQVLVEMV